MAGLGCGGLKHDDTANEPDGHELPDGGMRGDGGDAGNGGDAGPTSSPAPDATAATDAQAAPDATADAGPPDASPASDGGEPCSTPDLWRCGASSAQARQVCANGTWGEAAPCDSGAICIDADPETCQSIDCIDAVDCPTPSNPCRIATCEATGLCGIASQPPGTACPTGACDGQGACVCESHDDCPGSLNLCISGACVANRCGDQVVAGAEECDDGNDIDEDDCVACRNAFCGDGHTEAGVEQCDDGNSDNTDSCTNACNNAVCGDTFVYPAEEECDDGNDIDEDACVACRDAFCGDGHTEAGVEQCDDGNSDNTDSCTNVCNNAVCGDSYIRAGVEECDPNALGWSIGSCSPTTCTILLYQACSETPECAHNYSCDFGGCSPGCDPDTPCESIPGWEAVCGFLGGTCLLRCPDGVCRPGFTCTDLGDDGLVCVQMM